MDKNRKVVLIGASGVGKTECCNFLEPDENASSMDRRFQEYSPTLKEALDWIRTTPARVIAMSAHENLIASLFEAKRNKVHDTANIMFIHLYCGHPGTRFERLKNSGRQPMAVATAAAWDPLINDMCRIVAEVSINTATLDLQQVTEMIRRLCDYWDTDCPSAAVK